MLIENNILYSTTIISINIEINKGIKITVRVFKKRGQSQSIVEIYYPYLHYLQVFKF